MDTFIHNKEEGPGVTEIFVTRVNTDKIPAFRKWLQKLHQLETTFQGFKKSYVQVPRDNDENNWITLLQFDTGANLEKWLDSSERRTLLKEANEFVTSQQTHKLSKVFDGWFFEKKFANPPPLWKQTMLLIVALFPPLMLESNYLLPYMTQLNPVVAKFISVAITVSITSSLLMPFTASILSWWLQTHSKIKNYLGILLVITLYLLELTLFIIAN